MELAVIASAVAVGGTITSIVIINRLMKSAQASLIVLSSLMQALTSRGILPPNWMNSAVKPANGSTKPES